MNNSKSSGLYITVLSALFLLSVHTASAQSTIVTVPSTDVVADKNVYLEFDFISHYANHSPSSWGAYFGIGNGGSEVRKGSRLIPSTHEASRPLAVPASMKSRANFS